MLWGYALAWLGGLLMAAAAPLVPPAWLLTLFALSGVAALRWPALRLAACGVLGACWLLGHAHWQLAQEWPADRAGESVRVVGKVAGLPENRGQSVRFEFRPMPGQVQALPATIEVSWFRPREYFRPGELWELELRLQPPYGRLNPGGYDRRRHLVSQRIGATAKVAGHARRVAPAGPSAGIDGRRQYLAERLQAETTDLDAGALFRALGLADRSAMTPDLSGLLRRTGTAHLLAISGLHVGMVAGLFGLLGGWLLGAPLAVWTGTDRRRIGILIGLLAALAYAALAGFTLPTVRALIMLTVAGGALSLRRGVRPAHALLLALLAVLLVDPLAPLAVGFWLSFGAVAVLVWAFAWRPGVRALGWFKGLLLAQAVLAIGLLPLNVGIFQQMIPAAMVANLFAIPLVGLWILPALLGGLLMLLLGLPAAAFLLLAAQGIELLLAGLVWVDGLGWGYQRVASGGLVAIIMAMLGALWLLAPPGWPARWLGAVLLVPLLVPATDSLPPGALRLDMLDLGDGQAILIESGGRFLLYDTGPGDGEGRDSIGRLLSAPGRFPDAGSLDGVILSRQHRGHAGGMATARSKVEEGRLRVPPGFEGQACVAGEEWMLGAYTVRFLHPSAGLPPLGDTTSCVVLVQGPGGSLLLAGAIDAQVERRLLLDDPDLQADILVLAAGGHRRAGSAAFLNAVQPAWALASVARFDRFGRPHAELVERLERAGVGLISTAQCGAVSLRLEPGREPRMSSQRGQSRRFWEDRADCP